MQDEGLALFIKIIGNKHKYAIVALVQQDKSNIRLLFHFQEL